MRTFITVLIPIAMLAATQVPALAQSTEATSVWQIGTIDHSSVEFHGREAEAIPIVDANAPDAAAHWPESQAGSGNVKAGAKPHPRIVHFWMDTVTAGPYALEFHVLVGNPRVPRLDLELNGTPGTVYLNRKLTYFAEGRVDSPINGEADETVMVPEALLHQGQNELRITAVDETPDETGDSSIEWDALRMVRTGTAPAPEVAVNPTYFYVTEGKALKEMVEATAKLPGPVHEGNLTIEIHGGRYTKPLAAGRFGEQRFTFAVPEFAAGTEAHVSLTVDGKPQNTTAALTPKRKFTVMMVPHTHLDIGFTDYQPKIEELQNRNFDRLLAEIRKEPTMRFSADGVWLVEQYLRTRTPAAQKEFLAQVRAGHIAVPAQYANLMAGGAGLETLVRSLYAGQTLNRLAGRSGADYANITDVPAYPWSYASVLHAAGVHYFAAGANDDRGPQPLYGRWQTRSPFWWQGPDGGKVLMAYTRQYSQVWFVCGLPPQEAGCLEGLPTLFQTYEEPGYVPDTLLMFGSQLENTDLIPGEGEFVKHWNAKYAWPRLELATFRDYFERIEREYGGKLETVRGDFGPYWEDGIGTDAQFAALYRQTESRAAAVETLASFATLLEPQFAPPLDRLHRLWGDLVLYAEHTYTSWGGYSRPESEESVRQIETKHFHVSDAKEQAHWVANESMSRLMDQIGILPPALVAFNSLAHERDGLVEFDLDFGMEVVDAATEQTVPLETVMRGDGYRRVRFLAERVPALGYRVYRLRQAPVAGEGGGSEAAAAGEGTPAAYIENEFYRVTIDAARAAVTSVYDKQIQRELVDTQSPYLLNQYLYATGGDGTRLIYMRDHLPLAQLKVNTPGIPARALLRKTPWGQTLTLSYAGPDAHSIVTEIGLYDHAKRVDFTNWVAKDPHNEKEAIYFAFPFAAKNPQFEYEGENGTVDPARDALAGANREWFTVGHWASVTGGGISAAILPLDGPLMTFGDINRGRWPREFIPASAGIFAYALNNYWHTNFPRVQAGEFRFRYVLTSGTDLHPATLSRLGREALTGLEVGQLGTSDKVGLRGTLPAGTGSLLLPEGDGFELETIKPAEDGRGYILRFLETSGKGHDVRLRPALFAIERAWDADALENDRREISVSQGGCQVNLPANGIVTVRALLRRAAAR